MNIAYLTVYKIIAVICIECSSSSIISVSVGCSSHDFMIFLRSAKAMYVHLCFYLPGVCIIQRTLARQRCEVDAKLISGCIIYS